MVPGNVVITLLATDSVTALPRGTAERMFEVTDPETGESMDAEDHDHHGGKVGSPATFNIRVWRFLKFGFAASCTKRPPTSINSRQKESPRDAGGFLQNLSFYRLPMESGGSTGPDVIIEPTLTVKLTVKLA
ncbi:MAG: hypothetical protein ACO4CG_01780 [Prochlorothrix sp.]|nr:hypothetical protein [Prochlorothrix sp.]